LLVSGKGSSDLKIQSLRQPLRLLLQRVGGKVAAMDVHVVQIPAHLVALNAPDQIHPDHEGSDQHGHEQHRHQSRTPRSPGRSASFFALMRLSPASQFSMFIPAPN
jgi:hypothetical protein